MPSPAPTLSPTPVPSFIPTLSPTAPTPHPTLSPTPTPTSNPTPLASIVATIQLDGFTTKSLDAAKRGAFARALASAVEIGPNAVSLDVKSPPRRLASDLREMRTLEAQNKRKTSNLRGSRSRALSEGNDSAHSRQLLARVIIVATLEVATSEQVQRIEEGLLNPVFPRVLLGILQQLAVGLESGSIQYGLRDLIVQKVNTVAWG